MGAACTRTKHLTGKKEEAGGGRIITSDHDLLHQASSHLDVYQHHVTKEYILLPKTLDPATQDVLIGKEWGRLDHHHKHQQEIVNESRTISTALEQDIGRSHNKGLIAARPQDIGLELVEGGGGDRAAGAEATYRPPPLTSFLKCRICEREIPNKALLDEHLTACLLIAEAREQTRASDDALTTLSMELHKAIEDNMKIMLQTGKYKGGLLFLNN